MTRNWLLATMAFGLMVLAAAPPAAAQDDMITITAVEGDACGGDAFCFESSKETFEAGTIEFTFVNPDGNTQHNVCIAVKGSNHCTPGESTYSNGGETTTMEVAVSEAGTYTYWCNVPGHRSLGMEGTFTVTGGAMTGGDGDGNGGTTGGNGGNAGSGGSGGDRGSPGVGVLSIVAGVALLAVALRRH